MGRRRSPTVAEILSNRAAGGNGKVEHTQARVSDPEPPYQVETFTAAQLAAMELPEPRWAVSDILPAGMSVLAGKPKLGKSWLALLLALAIAQGGVALGTAVDVGSVLYLALEDTKRRLKGRLVKLLARQGFKAPDLLHGATSWPRQDKGGIYALAEWLDDHKDTRLVVIDTWAKFRPAKARGRDGYEEDYEHASEVKAVADKFGVAILTLHHCRKMEASDPIDSVSGTNGLTGCADALLVLKRERGQHDAALFLSGRDIEENELALQWDPAYCLWSVLGMADQYRLSKERSEVMDVLSKAGRPMTPTEVAPLLGKTTNAAKLLLWKLLGDGWLKSEGGKYTICKREET